ncbi:MAG: hypothetical protein KJS98_16735, partial [Nitrospirae bacterium]|nr:hypothetical protein [Nitrospirota bacterium]
MKRSVQPILAAVTVLLRPLVGILLRHGIPCDALCSVARHLYVRVATEEFTLPGRKQTMSRVSILTGLPRKEVRRIMATTDVQSP